MADLLVIVPTRGRPSSVARIVDAWRATGAFAVADLRLAIDHDDPARNAYIAAAPAGVGVRVSPQWQPMVHKLNGAASAAVKWGEWAAVAFMGDDHLPRTPGWARRYLDELSRLGTGIVYGNDLIQGQRLPTQWAMTSDIVRSLGRMVPAPVEHLYCDNSILDLGTAADCIRYLDDVVIEHCHPIAGRGVWDRGYEQVNSQRQYAKDSAAYQRWRSEQMADDVAAVFALRTREVSHGSAPFHGGP